MDRQAYASVKASALPERARDEAMLPPYGRTLQSRLVMLDRLYRTAVYVTRMYGGVGGEEP
jgi:hypothetical protein